MAKGLSAAKAKRILQDGYVKGKPLTAKQKKYFGAIASGGTPLKAINGNWLDKFAMGGSLPGASGMMYSRNSGSSAMSPPNLTKAQDGTVEYGTPEYKKAYEEGRFADVPNLLDEVVINSGVDYEKYPLYDDLSEQDKQYFNDDGPIGRGVRRRAQTKRGLAEDTYDVVNPIMYGALALAGGMAAGPSIATLGRGAAPYVSRYAINPIQRALSYKPFRGPVSISNIIDGSSAAYAGYATPEAYNKFKENPSFDTGLDLGLTAIDLVPFGEIFTGGKNIKNLYNKGKNLFTNDLTPNPNMYYRGIGQSGLDDITESGLLRAKPADQIPFNGMGSKFDFAKRFNNLYVTPRLNVADQYGRGVVAEIPKDIADFSKRYKNSDWSMMTNNQIPIEEVNLYKKNFFGNYKPVNIPQPSLSSMPFSKPNIYPTSSPLPKYMEPYLSRRVYPFNKEQEVFESFLSTDRRLNNIDSKSLYYNQAGKRITKGEADNLLYPPEYQKNGGDVDKAQYGRLLKWGKDIYDGIRGSDKAIDAVKIINKSGLDISNLGGTSKDIANVAKKIKDRLMTDKFITNNMNATGRTRQQVVESIENFTSEFNKGSITFEDFEKNLGGIYYGDGNIGINTNLKAARKDDVLGTIDHEVNHLFSDSKGSYVLVDGKLQKQPLYDNYPSLKITTDPSANIAGGSLYQSVAPEQQVRQRKAIAWLEENAGLKMGDDITEEMVEKLGIGLKEGEIKFAKRNTNGKWTAPPDEGGKFEYEFLEGDYKSGVEGGGQLQNGKYNDVGELLNNINDQSIVPPGSFSIVPTTPVGSKRWIKAVTNILNKTYTVGAVGGLGAASQMIGPTQADGQFKEGGEVPKAQFGWLNKLYKMYKGTNKVVDATSKTGKLKYMDELSSKAKKDVYEQNYEALSKTDKETRYLGKPHTAQEEYGEGWKYSDQVDFNNPEEVAAHRKRWIASQKKGNLINDNRRFPFFDETGDIFLDLSRKDLSDYLKKGLDKRFGTIGNTYTTGYGHGGIDYQTNYLNDYFKNYRVGLPDGSTVPYGKLDGSVEIDPSSFNSPDEVMEELRRLAQKTMGDQFNNAFEKTSRIDFGDLLKNKNRNGGWLSKYENGGVIEDDRGQWAHPGKITKINSNKITMKGVNYPVLGISDTGDKKMMQPGVENYTYDGSSVTEYPMAQEGAGVNKEGVKQYKWFKNYLQSPKYVERLKKEFPDYTDKQIGQEVKSRLENVMQTRVGFLPRSSDISTGVGGVQGVYDADEYPGSIMLRPEYSASTSDVLFEPGNYLSGYNTIPLHEWSHAADDGGNRMPQSTTDLMLSKMKENSLDIPKDKYYYTKPTEYLGRMQPLRYLMQEEGLYDAGTQDFTKEDLEKAKQNKTIKNNVHFQDLMENVKSDEGFIELMNKVASVDNSRSEYSMAKDGKSLVELDQLTNFTNYNTPQPGGWLDKY